MNVILLGNNAENQLDQFVTAAHAHVSPVFLVFFLLFSTIIQSVKALLTIGGWDNSIYWSSSVATPQNRSVFAHNVAQIARVHKLDGVDFE